MATLPDRLSDARTCTRDVAYDAKASALTIWRGKRATVYALAEGYVSPGYGDGRAFTLTKADGVVRNVFLATDRPLSTCDCEGCSYESAAKANRKALARGGKATETLGCCHLDGVAFAVDAGWLPDPRANPEADTGATETTDQPLPACFDGVSGTGKDCPF